MDATVMLFIALMTLSGSFGAFFFKKAIESIENFNIKNIRALSLCPWLYAGGGLYVLGAVFNILALRITDYSIVYPMSSLTYVWTMLVSFFLLGESVNGKKISAVIFIILGVFVLNL